MLHVLKSASAGGVRPGMYSNLPRPMESRSGFQGCIASLETNGELTDAINHALVPSVFVEEGCEGEAFFPLCHVYESN